jgi:SAM-dependent methyltransferase
LTTTRSGSPPPGDPTRRFTDRAADYARHRPSYPPELIALLRDEMGLRPEHVVVDVGSGTGILAEMLLASGNRVLAVEPNRAMAEEAIRRLGANPLFRDVDGRAEATGLDAGQVDFIVAAQAFHWFDPARSRDEFRRILKPEGWVALVWNVRRVDGTPFLLDYEAFLRRWGTDYDAVSSRYRDEAALATLFGAVGYHRRRFGYRQTFDLDGLRGRLLSSSYTPSAGDPRREAMLLALPDLFARHQQGGQVAFDYDTWVYYGRLAPSDAGVS